MKPFEDSRPRADATPARIKVLPAMVPPGAPRAEPLHITYTHTRVLPDAIGRALRVPGVAGADRGPLAEAFKVLRLQLRQRLLADGHRVLGVTSARTLAGKTHTALNLALAMAADLDTSVLLVDADLAGRTLQRLFGLDALPGLAEHLSGNRPLPELLVNPGVERLALLPAAGVPPRNAPELLATQRAQQLVAEVRTRYADRLIVVDLPPLLERADALAFLPHVDTTLLVVENHGTTAPDLERVAGLMAPFNLVGSVMAPPDAARADPGRRGLARWWPRRAAAGR